MNVVLSLLLLLLVLIDLTCLVLIWLLVWVELIHVGGDKIGSVDLLRVWIHGYDARRL